MQYFNMKTFILTYTEPIFIMADNEKPNLHRIQIRLFKRYFKIIRAKTLANFFQLFHNREHKDGRDKT